MTSSTNPDQILVCDLVIENVTGTIPPILKSDRLFRFGFLGTYTCVLVLPHAAVSVVGMIRISINLTSRDFSPAALCADKEPLGCVIDGTAY